MQCINSIQRQAKRSRVAVTVCEEVKADFHEKLKGFLKLVFLFSITEIAFSAEISVKNVLFFWSSLL